MKPDNPTPPADSLNELEMVLPRLLRERRIELGDTQIQFASRFGAESATAVSLWESGKRDIPQHVIEWLLVGYIAAHDRRRDEVHRAALNSILDAWTVQGTHPDYHKAQQLRLLQEWPTLTTAILNAKSTLDGNTSTEGGMNNQELAGLLAWAYKKGYKDAADVLMHTATSKALVDDEIEKQLLAGLETLPNNNGSKSADNADVKPIIKESRENE